MAMSAQQQNFISDMMAWSEQMLAVRAKGQELVARFNLNSVLSKLNDQEIAEIELFAHLDSDKVAGAVTALQIIDTALGDNVSGQATNLIKLKG